MLRGSAIRKGFIVCVHESVTLSSYIVEVHNSLNKITHNLIRGLQGFYYYIGLACIDFGKHISVELGSAHAPATHVTLTERFVPKVTCLEVIGDRKEPNSRELLIQRPQCRDQYH